MNAPAPIYLDQISPEWIAERREVIRRDGYAVRAGEGNTIELKSLTTNRWCVLTLPGGALAFAILLERDAVLHALTSSKPPTAEKAAGADQPPPRPPAAS